MSMGKKLRVWRSKVLGEALLPLFQEDKPSSDAQPIQETNDRTSRLGYPQQQFAKGGLLPDPQNVVMHSDLFKHTQNFAANNSIMAELLAAAQEETTLRLLARHVLDGAEFDSSARDPPPRCHPNTRTTLLGQILEWVSDQKKERRVLWLSGPAGVGKTAVSQTIAELSDMRSPTVFLSRPNRRNDPNRVIPTIAYQIAVREPAYQLYMQEELCRDPLLFQKSIAKQFHVSIAEPAVKGGISSKGSDLIILLDALDECEDEEAQVNIIRLIADFTTKHPSVPLGWIISSRPEEHLRRTFSSPDIESCIFKLQLSMDGEEARDDVRRYLMAGFGDIRQRYPFSTPSSWPTDADLGKIVNAASGWFLFASTLLRFVMDLYMGYPISRLDSVVSAIDESSWHREDPFEICSIMYGHALYQVHNTLLPIVQILLGHLILREAFLSTNLSLFGYSLYSASNILGFQEKEVYGALRKLYSFLHIPSPDSAHRENIRFFHTSFPTFLKYPERSGKYAIDLPKTNTQIWGHYARILDEVNNNSNPRFRTAPQLAITLSWPLKGSKYERWRFTSGLLYEAQFHWAHFLIPDCPCISLPNSGPLGTTLLTDQDRIRALQIVNFKMLVTGYFVEGSDHIGPFFTYVCGLWQSSREELEECGLMRESSLENLAVISIDTETLATKDYAICVERKVETQRDGTKASYSWRTREMLMDALVEEVDALQHKSPKTRVLICGGKSGKQGALINYEYHDKQEPAVVYYYLPLVDSL